MNDRAGQNQAQLASRLMLETLAPLFGLDVDGSRVASLESLARLLLEHGERLTRTVELTAEPYFVGAAGEASG